MIPGVNSLSSLALVLFIAVSVVLPLVSSLLTKAHMPDDVRALLTMLLAAVTGLLTEALKAGDGFAWKHAALAALVSYVIAAVARVQAWAGSKTDAKLLAVGSRKP